MDAWSKSPTNSYKGTVPQAQDITCLSFPIFCKTDYIGTCKLKTFMVHTNVKTLFHNCGFPEHYNIKTQEKNIQTTHW